MWARRGEDERDAAFDLEAVLGRDLIDVLEPGRLSFFILALDGRFRLVLVGTSDDDPAEDSWRASLPEAHCEFFGVKILRGIFDRDLGVSGLLGDLLANLSCLIVDFLMMIALIQLLNVQH